MSEVSEARARFLAGAERAHALLGEGPAQARCEAAVATFMTGVRRWSPQSDDFGWLDELEPFAWEGVGLAAALEGAFESMLARRPDRSALMFVGLGWSHALAGEGGARPDEFAAWQECFDDDPWLLFDGQGYASTLLRRRSRSRAQPDDVASTWFDQGCGRALYYLHGGRASALEWAIRGLGRARAPALWRGIGVASRFTDGLDESERVALREHGGEHLLHGERLAQRLRARLSPRASGDTSTP